MSAAPSDTVHLQHVIVVGGAPADWAGLSDDQWHQRLTELGKVADDAGVHWVVLRPYGPADAPGVVREALVGQCTVVANPQGSGRRRLAAALAGLSSAGAITEDGVDVVLNAPAEVDPDLVVIMGPTDRLPSSLVWELAYSELVFTDVPFAHFTAAQLDEAMASFAHRHRRFGGVD